MHDNRDRMPSVTLIRNKILKEDRPGWENGIREILTENGK